MNDLAIIENFLLLLERKHGSKVQMYKLVHKYYLVEKELESRIIK